MSNVHPIPTAANVPAEPAEAEIKFAYWVPNVSGGLVVSEIEQRTHHGIEYNRKLAQIAERSGFDYALGQVHNLDRHWRNARTHTLHDPVRWKYAILGNYHLNGVNPPLHAWS